MLPFSDEMTFVERWFNSLVGSLEWAIRKFGYLPQEEGYTRKYFGHLGKLPTIDELHRKVALVLVNSHRALSPPRPSMPSIFTHLRSVVNYAVYGINYFFSRLFKV